MYQVLKTMEVGFIGQGWIGKHYADDFENRGYEVVRYSLEAEYVGNKERISGCDIVFVAVPTPTTEKGFDDSLVHNALQNIGKGKIAVIKSTILPGTTEKMQGVYPDIFVLHSPEFLVEKTAAYDAAHPNRTIIGIPFETDEYQKKAEDVCAVLPPAPYKRIMRARDAELVKYAGNCFLFTKVIYMNLLYDLVGATGGNWQDVQSALTHDPRIGLSHTEPIHKSRDGGKAGRGAGGDCFIKDFEAFRRMYEEAVLDPWGVRVLQAEAEKNINLLATSEKDLELLVGVYGDVTKYCR